MKHAAWSVPGYTLDSLLGVGGAGQVWRATVRSTGEAVALKRVPIWDGASLAAVRAEVATLASLDHPHLMRVHDLVLLERAAVLVMDLADGGSLEQLVAARGRLTPGEVISAVAPVAAAAAYLHNAGVVHGDITPANLVFTAAGLPLLTDLGVSRLAGDASPARSTPCYVDPSVAAGGIPGASGDVFMLGGTALYALTGEPLWRGSSPEEVLAAAADGVLDDVEARLTGAAVPDAIRAVVVRALTREPALRGTAADFALDLRHAGEPVAVELAAGRARVEPSSEGRDEVPGAGDAVRPDHEPSAGRPAFARPGPVPGRHAAGRPALTYGARLPAPRAFAPTQRARRARRRPRRAVGLGLVVAAGGAAGLLWFGRTGSAAQTGVPVAPARPTPSLSAHPAPGTDPLALDAATAATVLTRLDGYREQAFARRDPGLLAKVYAAGPLLAQDEALLDRLVPVGCGLLGVRTEYGAVTVVGAAAGGVDLTVRATLGASTVRCGGSSGPSAPGTPPTLLHVVLARRGADVLITAIRQEGA